MSAQYSSVFLWVAVGYGHEFWFEPICQGRPFVCVLDGARLTIGFTCDETFRSHAVARVCRNSHPRIGGPRKLKFDQNHRLGKFAVRIYRNYAELQKDEADFKAYVAKL